MKEIILSDEHKLQLKQFAIEQSVNVCFDAAGGTPDVLIKCARDIYQFLVESDMAING